MGRVCAGWAGGTRERRGQSEAVASNTAKQGASSRPKKCNVILEQEEQLLGHSAAHK